MSDCEQLIDQIRAFVQSADQTRTPALEALAVSFAEAGGEVGRRLSKCCSLLRQGLRSEAIQLAETAPRLLDQVAALDFPERAAWDEIVQLYDLLPAPPIPVESASFLNEAYAEEDPLQDLLRSHRRLALVRAPLSDRIRVMRKLATLDPNNPIWPEDLQTFERARFAQLDREVAQAEKAGDADAVARLLAELEGQAWLEAPPDSLTAPLRRLNAKLQGKRKLEKLADYERRLGDAFAARDAARGRMARKGWLDLAESMGLRPGDPMRDRALPALRWLDEQDRLAAEDRRQQAAYEELTALLDDPGPVPSMELERLAGELGGLRESLPEHLAERFSARLTLESGREARRRAWIIGGASAAVILIAASAAFAYRGHLRSTRATRAAVAVADMLELGELERALEFVAALAKTDAALVEAREFHDARSRLKIEEEKEATRAFEFDKALRLADQAPVLDEEPMALEEARKLARLDTEKAAVDQRAGARREAARVERSRREEELAPRIQELEDQANRLMADYRRGAESGDVGRFLDPLVKLQNDCRAFDDQARSVGPEFHARLAAVTARLNNLGADFDRARRLKTAEDQLTIAATYAPTAFFDPDRFADSLDAYAKALSDSNRAEEVARVRKEARIWKAVVAWDQLLDRWSEKGADLSPVQASIRLEACSKFINDHSWYPRMEFVETYKEELEATSSRSAGGPQSPAGRLRALLSDSMIDAVWMVQVRRQLGGDPDCYYLARRPDEGSNLLQYIENFDRRERSRTIVLQNIRYSDWSPQTKLADKYKPRLAEELTSGRWDETMLAMLADVRDDSMMDPILKMVLLKKICESAAAGGKTLATPLAPTSDMLRESDIDTNVPWMDPTNTIADRLRPRAAALIKSLPSQDSVVQEHKKQQRFVDWIATASPRVVGWLAREGDSWVLHAGKSLPPGGGLWTAAPDGESKAAFKEIGGIRNGEPRVESNDAEALAEGRPVFVWSENEPLF